MPNPNPTNTEGGEQGKDVEAKKTPDAGAAEGAAKGAEGSDANPKRLLTFEDITEGRIKPMDADPKKAPDEGKKPKSGEPDGSKKDTDEGGEEKKVAKTDEEETDENGDVIDHFYEKDGDEYKKISVDEALENLQVTLKVNGKQHELEGWDEVKKWASIGLASEEKRRKANEVFEENKILKATIKAEAEKIAQERVQAYINDVLEGKKPSSKRQVEDADEDAEEVSGKTDTSSPVFRHLLAEVKRLRDERESEKREKEEADRTAAQQREYDSNVKTASEMYERVGNSYKDQFTIDGKLDEDAFNAFSSYVTGSTQAILSRELDGDEDFKEVLAKGEKTIRKVAKRYFDNLEAQAERLAQAKLKAKKGEPSKAVAEDEAPEPSGTKKKLRDWNDITGRPKDE